MHSQETLGFLRFPVLSFTKHSSRLHRCCWRPWRASTPSNGRAHCRRRDERADPGISGMHNCYCGRSWRGLRKIVVPIVIRRTSIGSRGPRMGGEGRSDSVASTNRLFARLQRAAARCVFSLSWLMKSSTRILERPVRQLPATLRTTVCTSCAVFTFFS